MLKCWDKFSDVLIRWSIRMILAKNYETVFKFVKVMPRKLVASFFPDTVYTPSFTGGIWSFNGFRFRCHLHLFQLQCTASTRHSFLNAGDLERGAILFRRGGGGFSDRPANFSTSRYPPGATDGWGRIYSWQWSWKSTSMSMSCPLTRSREMISGKGDKTFPRSLDLVQSLIWSPVLALPQPQFPRL